MKKAKWIIGVIVLIVVVGIFYISYNKQVVGDDWVVELTTGADAMLAAECADEEFILNDADYILDIRIKEISGLGDEKQHSLDIEGWIKGEPAVFPNTLTIKTTAIVSSADPVFEEGKDYRINLKRFNNKIIFVCGSAGVKEMQRIDDL